MASRRRAAEDKNTKLLREIATKTANKQCFDCLQRGPTYINVTIGSFVCTTCSGILRGLTPPHRLKSISMTTFTPEEIEQLQSRGNEYCRYVWLGLFDTSSNSIENEVSDDQRKRDFMIQKYEKKRWYVDPDVAVKKLHSDMLQKQKQGVQVQSQNYSTRHETQPLSKLLGKSPTPLVVHNNQNTESWPHPVSSASAHTVSTKTSTLSHGSRSFDLLAEFAAVSTAKTSTADSTANGNFANFETAFNSAEKTGNAVITPPMNMTTSASLDAYPMPVQNAFGLSATEVSTTSAKPSTTDRYAALADLDSLFSQSTATKAPSWTVDTISSTASQDRPSNERSKNMNNAASSNPFASADVWSQPPPVKSSFQSANPFQAVTEGTNNFTPFQVPMVGNSPSDDTTHNQFNANYSAFPNQGVTSPVNGYGSNQMLLQNGGLLSPTSGSNNPWSVSSGMPTWSSSHPGLGGLFSNKPTEPAQHADWMQNPVNPFMVHSNSVGFPAAPKSNCSNPFL